MPDGDVQLPAPPPDPVDIQSETKRLTDRLLAFEQYLIGLPWKTEAEVRDGQFRLRFERRDRGWALVAFQQYYTVTPMRRSIDTLAGEPEQEHWNEALLRDASISNKARAAALLPKLLESMRAEYDQRTQDLAQGHRALDQLEQALDPVRMLTAQTISEINHIPFGEASVPGGVGQEGVKRPRRKGGA